MKSGTKLIVNSIFWAAAILASAIIFKGSDMAETMMLILVSFWFSSFLILQAGPESIQKEWACIKRFFSR